MPTKQFVPAHAVFWLRRRQEKFWATSLPQPDLTWNLVMCDGRESITVATCCRTSSFHVETATLALFLGHSMIWSFKLNDTVKWKFAFTNYLVSLVLLVCYFDLSSPVKHYHNNFDPDRFLIRN